MKNVFSASGYWTSYQRCEGAFEISNVYRHCFIFINYLNSSNFNFFQSVYRLRHLSKGCKRKWNLLRGLVVEGGHIESNDQEAVEVVLHNNSQWVFTVHHGNHVAQMMVIQEPRLSPVFTDMMGYDWSVESIDKGVRLWKK